MFYPLTPKPEAMALMTTGALAHLRRLGDILASVSSWSSNELCDLVRGYVAESQVKLVEVAQPLRVALTGTTASPPIFEVMDILGKNETLARIAFATRERGSDER